MARKYDLISELYRRTAHAVVSDAAELASLFALRLPELSSAL